MPKYNCGKKLFINNLFTRAKMCFHLRNILSYEGSSKINKHYPTNHLVKELTLLSYLLLKLIYF